MVSKKSMCHFRPLWGFFNSNKLNWAVAQSNVFVPYGDFLILGISIDESENIFMVFVPYGDFLIF